MIDPADMEQVNPVVRDERISIVFDDTVTSPSEPGARFLRASFLIRSNFNFYFRLMKSIPIISNKNRFEA